MKLIIGRSGKVAGALALMVSLLVCGCTESNEPAYSAAAELYVAGKASADGIGKYYMGREISKVMGHRGAAWLDRRERATQERTDLLIENLAVKPSDHIADVGAGTGYFTIPMAKLAHTGRVYAVDIVAKMLAMIGAAAENEKLDNVETVLASEADPNLARRSIDLALLVDAYHEFSHPYEVMRGIVHALKPGGRAVLVEYRGGDPRVPILRLHKMTEQQVIKEMTAIDLEWVEARDFLPQQHFIVFRKP